MARLTKAQRKVKNIAKQEKLKRERTKQQGKPVDPPLPTAAIAEPTKEPQAPIPNESAEEQAGNKTRKRPPATRAENAIALCTVALLVAAIVQAGAMIAQNSIMQKQMAQTANTLELMRQERSALVSVMPPVVQDFTEGKQPTFTYGLQNSGHTPAKITLLRYKPFFADAHENIRPRINSWSDVNSRQRKGMVITADGIQISMRLDDPIPKHEIDHVKERIQVRPNMGARRMYFVVDVTYTDELDTEGHTRAVYYYMPDQDRFVHETQYDVIDRKRKAKSK